MITINNHNQHAKTARSKPHVCDLCSKKFARAHDLHRHRATYESAYFPCQYLNCRSRYNRIDNLKKHMAKRHGCTPLHYTLSNEAAIQLIKQGADPNALDNDGIKPLFTAFTNEQEDLAHLLFKFTTNLNDRNLRGQTSLHTAAELGKYTLLNLLLETNLDVNAKNDFGETPLARAVKWGRPDAQNRVMKLLIDRGADVNATANIGMAILEFAIRYRTFECVKILIDGGADVKALVKYSGYIDPKVGTLLHLAAAYGCLSVIKLLIDVGIDINSRSACGDSALMVAVEEHQSSAVEVLLQVGADIDLRNPVGETALDLALIQKQSVWSQAPASCQECINMLESSNGRRGCEIEPIKP